jgi:hypothetical protein
MMTIAATRTFWSSPPMEHGLLGAATHRKLSARPRRRW